MREIHTHLDWDSDCFGFKVARIIPADLTESELRATLDHLGRNNYRLVYWQLAADEDAGLRLAQACGGFLADEKRTYLKQLAAAPEGPRPAAYTVLPYDRNSPEAGLVALALEAAEYSRFRLDPLFPAELCDKLFTCWITNSVSREIADRVLVVREGAELLGMITLGHEAGRGDIGLLAVAQQARGRGLGKLLVKAAEGYFAEQGYRHAQVVTQGANAGACRLYESCQFEIENSSHFFHFWL